MNNMHYLEGKKRKIFMTFVEISVVIMFLLISFMGYESFGDMKPPITLHEPAIVSSEQWTDKEATVRVVHIERDVTYNNGNSVTLDAELMNEGGELIELQTSKVSAEKLGRFKTRRLYYVSRLSAGKWCLKTTEYWTPFMSLRERYYVTPESCFTVEK